MSDSMYSDTNEQAYQPSAPPTQAQRETARTDVAQAEIPGMIMFAGIMLFILAGCQIVWALVQIFTAPWVSSTVYGTFGGYLWLWGILDALFAVIAFYAGYEILNGQYIGQVLGLAIATFSAIRWFFYIPAAPWLAVVIIGIDIAVIYGLVAHADYFEAMSDT